MRRLKENTVLIVGLGQIGGSIALDLTRSRRASLVIGFDKNSRVASRAKKLGIIDRAAPSLKDAVPLADLIVLAAPIGEIIKLLPRIARFARADAVCLDVASTKSQIVMVASRLKPRMNYVGGHPIAGTERTGLSAATPGQFKGKPFVLTPLRTTDSASLERVAAAVRALGARPLILSPTQHDTLTAVTIGLPHTVALALRHLAVAKSASDPHFPKMIGGSFRSATRVAGSPPHLVTDLLWTNRVATIGALDDLMVELARVRRSLAGTNDRHLKSYVRKAHR